MADESIFQIFLTIEYLAYKVRTGRYLPRRLMHDDPVA